MKFSNLDGKALLHDIDSKFDEQERIIKFLVGQINNLDQNMQSMNKKTQGISDLERDARAKLETSLKLNNDQSLYNMQELA